MKDLSGGERNRLHLATLLKSGGNLLLLDEPTNDLDVDTLRALEEALLSFAGCAVVISHDRWFLDRIATHILAFEGDSQVVWFEGNYQDYEADRKRRLGADADQPHRIKYRKLKSPEGGASRRRRRNPVAADPRFSYSGGSLSSTTPRTAPPGRPETGGRVSRRKRGHADMSRRSLVLALALSATAATPAARPGHVPVPAGAAAAAGLEHEGRVRLRLHERQHRHPEPQPHLRRRPRSEDEERASGPRGCRSATRRTVS